MIRILVVAAAIALMAMGCGGGTRPQATATLVEPGAGRPSSSRRIDIAVVESGFEPTGIKVASGETVTLVFTRRTEHTCAKEVVVYLSDDKTVKRDLPLNQPVEVTVMFSHPGELGYACGMSMHGGVIEVR